MKLLVDIGNHRLKWATSTQLEGGNSGSTCADQAVDTSGPAFADSLAALQGSVGEPDTVWVASVAEEAINSAVTTWVHATWGLQAEFLESTARACGVANGYTEPGALGVDRWAAILAACNRAPGLPVLIIDAGTAVTIDYVGSDRIFRGGVIVPGLHAMFNSLNVSTAQISSYTGRGSGGDLVLQNPDTRGAVENGVRLALAGAVDDAVDYYTGIAGKDLRIFVAGGDAAWIQKHCRNGMEVAPALVLEGLNALGSETPDGGIPQ